MGDNPEQYTENKTSTNNEYRNGSIVYTCPMHPEVRQNGPGSCPKCGMALEPVTVGGE